MARIRLLDGLRAVAALLVLLSHVSFWTGASSLDVIGGLLARGDSGVAVFFALSAFLLLRPWARHALLGTRRPDGARYAVRRLARILPAYWLALLAVLVVAALATSTGGLRSWGTVLAHVFVLQGLTGHTYQSFSQTWSLTTELVFYVLVPPLGLLATRLVRGRSDQRSGVGRVLRGCAALVLLGLAAQAVATAWTLAGSHGGAGVLATSVIGHAAWFAVGAAVALLTTAQEAGALPWSADSRLAGWARLARHSPATVLVAAVPVYLLAATPLAGPRDLTAPTVAQAVAKELVYTLLALLLLVAAVMSPRTGGAGELVGRHPAVHWLGDISYGVFLWHVLVLQVLYVGTGRPLFSGGFWWVLVIVTALTVALSSVSAQLLEQPVLRWAHRATAPAPARQG